MELALAGKKIGFEKVYVSSACFMNTDPKQQLPIKTVAIHIGLHIGLNRRSSKGVTRRHFLCDLVIIVLVQARFLI